MREWVIQYVIILIIIHNNNDNLFIFAPTCSNSGPSRSICGESPMRFVCPLLVMLMVSRITCIVVGKGPGGSQKIISDYSFISGIYRM